MTRPNTRSVRFQVTALATIIVAVLLSAVAVYAAGGQQALQDFSKTRSEVVRRLTRQLGKD